MSAEKSFYVVREPEWTVVFDTDKEPVALFVGPAVRTQRGAFTKPEFIGPAKPVREMLDPNSLQDAQDYQETRYWVV